MRSIFGVTGFPASTLINFFSENVDHFKFLNKLPMNDEDVLLDVEQVEENDNIHAQFFPPLDAMFSI